MVREVVETEGSPPKKLRKTDGEGSAGFSDVNEPEVVPPFVPSQHPFGPNTEEWHPAGMYYVPIATEVPQQLAANITSSTLIEDVQAFRNNSIAAIHEPRAFRPTKVTLSEQPIPTVSSVRSRPFALYVIHEEDDQNQKEGWLLRPVHKELVYNDRPDLFTVFLNVHAKNLVTNERYQPWRFAPGDLLIVYELSRHRKKWPRDLPTSFVNLYKPSYQRFWLVKEYDLVSRHIETRKLAFVPIAKHTTAAPDIFVHNVDSPARTSKSTRTAWNRESESAKREDEFALVDVLVPFAQTRTSIRGVGRESDAALIDESCRAQCEGNDIAPMVMSISRLDPETLAQLAATPMVFDPALQWDLGQRLGAFENALQVATSAIWGLSTKPRDERIYTTKIVQTSNRRRLEFRLQKNTGKAPAVEDWLRGTHLKISFDSNIVIHADVEFSTIDPDALYYLHVRALIIRISEPHDNALDQLDGQPVVVTQVVSESIKTNDLFNISAQQIEAAGSASNGFKVLQAAFGGAALEASWKDYGPTDRDLEDVLVRIPDQPPPTREQAHFILEYGRAVNPCIVVNASFGSGKTTTLARAAIDARSIDDRYARSRSQLLITVTNAATSALLDAIKKMDKDEVVPVTRLITSKNAKRLNIELPPKLDFSKAWKKILLDYYERENLKLWPHEKTEDTTLIAAVRHLHNNNVLELKDILNTHLYSEAKKNFDVLEPAISISKERTAELIVGAPLLVGTLSSAIQMFSDDPGMRSTDDVSRIIVDEASMLPAHAFIVLLQKFPNATITLVGDAAQLPAFADAKLPNTLRNIAVRKLLQELYTKKQMPTIHFSTVFRCPKETTDLLSRLFYSGRLRSSRKSKERCEATEVLGLPTSYPTQFIFADGEEVGNGSTFFNREEAKLAWKLLKHLRSKMNKEASIAVITFYSSQVGYFNTMDREEGVADFVGTVDSSQGKEYDVVILLTTRTTPGSKFIEDPERVNVALSRARKLNLVIFNKQAFPIGVKSVWRKMEGQIPKAAMTERKDLKF